jgi:thermopsin
LQTAPTHLGGNMASTFGGGGGMAPVLVKNSANVVNGEPRVLPAANYWPRTPAPTSLGSTAASPGCSSTTACPMGVVDYGLTGSLASYSYNSKQVESFADISNYFVSYSSGGGCLDSSAYSCGGIQSNWIDNGVEVHGHAHQYWSQNVAQVAYDSSCTSPCVSGTYSVTWLDNLWNFSDSGGICPSGSGAGCMNAGDITGNGQGACSSHGGAPTYYYCIGPTVYDLTMPFTVWTFMSTGPGSIAGPCGSVTTKSCVDFYGGIIEDNSFVYGSYYDSVVFTTGSHGGGSPSFHVANTNAPYGLPYDGEWVVCGPAGGAYITLGLANLNLQTIYYNGTAHAWTSIRHAWSSGDDTAEAVSNLNMFGFDALRDSGAGAIGTENQQSSLW